MFPGKIGAHSSPRKAKKLSEIHQKNHFEVAA